MVVAVRPGGVTRADFGLHKDLGRGEKAYPNGNANDENLGITVGKECFPV